MRRRTIIIPLLLIFATAIGLSLRNYQPEPEYQNHPLSYWLNYNPREENQLDDQLRYTALETIGTNALPIYVTWLHSKDPYPKQKLIEWLDLIHVHVRPAAERQVMAKFGWRTAGLSHQLINPNVWEDFCRNELVIHLRFEEQHCINSLLNGTAERRLNAAFELNSLSAKPEVIKALTSALKDPSPKVRYFVARALAVRHEHSQPAIPALIQSLQDENEFVRMTAAFALGKFGKGATNAKTALLPLLKDPNPDVHACAKLALQQIDADAIVIQAKK